METDAGRSHGPAVTSDLFFSAAAMSRELYENPLIERYASAEMSRLWGPQRKFQTWRRLWVALAESQAELGLQITEAQLDAMRRVVADIDFEAAARYEAELRHDVMAHVHTFGDACPAARGIIHLGATSCFVTDNADVLLLREALQLVCRRVARVIDRLGKFADEHRSLACLGMTHLQPAQPTTVGKRACLWAYDLALDLAQLEAQEAALLARGAKGTTGTQASFLRLFEDDHEKVKRLDALVTEKMGFRDSYAVTGQTYPRKVDAQILAALCGVAQSAHKTGNDLRLLQSWKEIDEPLEASQVGSSAMPYKTNPMRAERMCGLARFVTSLATSAAQTASAQWMERTLDDSANRRLVLPQGFLAIDAVLLLYENVASGLVVYPRVIARRLAAELPFMATENLIMEGVAAGGDRQDLHERIRQHARAAGDVVKNEGRDNDLLARIRADEAFAQVDVPTELVGGDYVGRAPEQVDEFLAQVVAPVRERYADALAGEAQVHV